MAIKSLLPGIVALMVAGGAQAADLPLAPEPVDYVRVCDTYGTGFFYIPGTETCLRVAGRVRAEYRLFDLDQRGSRGRDADRSRFRVRGYLRMESRTETEFGLLRTYLDTYWTQDSGRDVTVSMEQAFIQWGGLTAGRTDTFFQFYTGNTYDSLFDPAFIDMQTNVLAYKATLGNGVSAAISIEDGTTPRQAIRPVNPAFTNAYGGHWWPDLVGHIRLEQSWGSAQIMAALHDVRDGVGPVDNSELGWAIGAGAKIGLPMIAKGDWLGLQLVYADGAIRYAGQMQTFAFDGTRRPSGAIVTTTAFGVSGCRPCRAARRSAISTSTISPAPATTCNGTYRPTLSGSRPMASRSAPRSSIAMSTTACRNVANRTGTASSVCCGSSGRSSAPLSRRTASVGRTRAGRAASTR